eukprot:scaffold69_cov248-Pinguiococcus_pyrenoidosus.AAC.52
MWSLPVPPKRHCLLCAPTAASVATCAAVPSKELPASSLVVDLVLLVLQRHDAVHAVSLLTQALLALRVLLESAAAPEQLHVPRAQDGALEATQSVFDGLLFTHIDFHDVQLHRQQESQIRGLASALLSQQRNSAGKHGNKSGAFGDLTLRRTRSSAKSRRQGRKGDDAPRSWAPRASPAARRRARALERPPEEERLSCFTKASALKTTSAPR